MAQTYFHGEVPAMTAQAADQLLKMDSGDAALLYLHLLCRGSLAGLNWPEARLQLALGNLQSQGVAPGLHRRLG